MLTFGAAKQGRMPGRSASASERSSLKRASLLARLCGAATACGARARSGRWPRLGNRGVTTIEFAIVGPMFLFLILTIIEVGFMLFVQAVLDGSARDAARLIRTGQAQNSANAMSTFSTALCNQINPVIGCNNIVFQVQTMASWSNANTSANTGPVIIQSGPNKGKIQSAGFTAGSSNQIELVQVYYKYPFMTAWVGSLLGGTSQSTILQSTVAFQNEPY